MTARIVVAQTADLHERPLVDNRELVARAVDNAVSMEFPDHAAHVDGHQAKRIRDVELTDRGAHSVDLLNHYVQRIG